MRQAPFILLILLFLGSCDLLGFRSDSANQEDGSGANTPAIPRPDNANDELPEKSEYLVTGTEVLDDFSLYMDNGSNKPAYLQETAIQVLADQGFNVSSLTLNPPGYYPLLKEGGFLGNGDNWTPNSEVPLRGNTNTGTITLSFNTLLAEAPRIQRRVYWQKVVSTTLNHPSEFSQDITYTRGTSETTGESFSRSLSIEANYLVKVSAKLSETFSHNVTISASEEKNQHFGASSVEGKTIVFTVWQLIEEYRIVNSDGTAWSDDNYSPADESVPVMTNALEVFYQDTVDF